jgi:hypothetical protein
MTRVQYMLISMTSYCCRCLIHFTTLISKNNKKYDYEQIQLTVTIKEFKLFKELTIIFSIGLHGGSA